MGYIKSLSIGLLALGLFLGGVYTAKAEQNSPCDLRPEVLGNLERQYGEAVIFQGLASYGMIEITVNPETGTWTVLVTFPDGQGTCIKGDGSQHEIFEYVKPTVES